MFWDDLHLVVLWKDLYLAYFYKSFILNEIIVKTNNTKLFLKYLSISVVGWDFFCLLINIFHFYLRSCDCVREAHLWVERKVEGKKWKPSDIPEAKGLFSSKAFGRLREREWLLWADNAIEYWQCKPALTWSLRRHSWALKAPHRQPPPPPSNNCSFKCTLPCGQLIMVTQESHFSRKHSWLFPLEEVRRKRRKRG